MRMTFLKRWLGRGDLASVSTKGVVIMAKADDLAPIKAQLEAAQGVAEDVALSAAYDAGVASVPPSQGGGGFAQSDIDAAVKAAVDPLNAQISGLQSQVVSDAQSLSDAQAKAASDLAAVQQALSDMTAKEQLEEQAVLGLQNSVAAVQQSLDAIKALIIPQPVPVQPAS